MKKLNVYSEIGTLKTIMLHEPGEELDNLIPKYLEDLLFDDIPWLPLAIKEHRAFAQAFRDAGVNVVYLENLMTETLEQDNKIKQEFIDEFISEAGIHSEILEEKVREYLNSFEDTKKMVLKTMAGIKKTELKNYDAKTLSDFVSNYPFVTDPMPNLYFTRDPFAVIGNGVSLNKMYSVTRCRETIFGKFIFKYHKEYKNSNLFYNRENYFNIEGGDILVLNKKTLLIGVSQRTTPSAIEQLAKNVFFKFDTEFETILVFSIPKFRTFMHLDTVFTQVDYDKFTIHKGCYENLEIFAITKNSENKTINVNKINEKPEKILEKHLGKKIYLIPCGGDDSVSADREQWSDGSNTVAIAPGEVITYERNDITNNILKSYGIKVHTIPSSELSRGRGGPRCMCMPLFREDIKE